MLGYAAHPELSEKRIIANRLEVDDPLLLSLLRFPALQAHDYGDCDDDEEDYKDADADSKGQRHPILILVVWPEFGGSY